MDMWPGARLRVLLGSDLSAAAAAAVVVVGWDVYWKTKFTYLPSRG